MSSQVLNKMRTTMRQRMEKDLREIQDELNNEDESCFHRQLDADVLKKEFQLATYKASKLKWCERLIVLFRSTSFQLGLIQIQGSRLNSLKPE